MFIFNGTYAIAVALKRRIAVYMPMRRNAFPFLLFALLFTAARPALGQKYFNNWFFGGYAAIDFNTSPPSKILNSAMLADEGCSSVSDPATGTLLFYTNGDTVWNRNHQKMPNGIGLGGHRSSTQSSLVVPDPGNPQRYYIFSVFAQANEYAAFCCGSGGLNLNTVDMTLDGGLGDVVVKDQLVLTPTTEKLTAVKQCNGHDFWVVTHEWHSRKFYAYPLTDAGIGMPVISDIGMLHTDVGSGNAFETIGYMRISPDGKRIALAASREANRVEMFGFDDATGQVGPVIFSDGNYPNLCGYTGPYGVCFSPDGSRLYVSVSLGGCNTMATDYNRLFQYDLTSGDSTAIIASRVELQTTNSNAPPLAAIQIGPDGRIYVAKVGSLYLDIIQNPNAAGMACNYTVDGFLLNVPGSDNTSKYGLPNAVESWLAPRQQFQLTFEGCVQSDTVTFLDTVLSQPYTVQWDFGDPASNAANTSNNQHAFHGFTSIGLFDVTLSVFLPCDTLVIEKTIHSAGSGQVFAGPDTTICNGDSFTVNANGGSDYTWSPGDGLSCTDCAQPIASPSQSTTYIVTSNSTTPGCSLSDTMVVTVLPAPLLLTSGDVTVCGNAEVQLSASGATTYQWSPPDGLSDSAIANPVAHVTASLTYTLVGYSGACAPDTETVAVTVAPPASVDAAPDTTLIAGQSVQLVATSLATTFTWLPSESLSDPHSGHPVATPAADTWYTVTVTDVNGCSAVDSVFVSVKPDDGVVIVPNVFSPNGDGINDELVYFSHNVESMDFRIFNRWGENVFATTAMNAFWDGTYKNKIQGNGVFVYELTALTSAGRTIHLRGNFTLLR